MMQIGQRLVAFLLASILSLVLTAQATAQNDPSPVPPSPPNKIPDGVVILENETLFAIETQLSGASAQLRAERVNQRLREFAENQALPLEELKVYNADEEGIPLTAITAGDMAIFAISDADAKLAGKSREKLGQEYLQKIKDAVIRYRTARSSNYLFVASLWAFVATILFVFGLYISNNTFIKIYLRIRMWGESYIHPLRIGTWELIRPNQLDNILIWLVRLLHASVVLCLLIAYFTFVLKQFPGTRGISKTFEAAFVRVIQSGWDAFIDYLPNLFTIVLVSICTSFLIRVSKPFFRELSEGNLSIPGFYPEWAEPTHNLINFFIIALSAVIIFPLLPGFQSPAFQGISVFLGLLISLGSSSIISNLVSGIILIYSRLSCRR